MSFVPTPSEVEGSERRAATIVGLIRRIVDALRTVDGFEAVTVPKNRIVGKKQENNDGGEETTTGVPARPRRSSAEEGRATTRLEDVRLMPLLQSCGLVEDVRAACAAACESGRDAVAVEDADAAADCACGANAGSSGTEDAATTKNSMGTRSHGDGESDRRDVVRNVCLPLLASLAECYAVLDAAEAAAPPTGPSPSPPTTARRSNRGKGRPAPPRGLLSLADYTDVACLLEFVVCASIVPHLERGVLPHVSSVEERVRYLPKSLGGRLRRRSLLWGSAVKASVARPANGDGDGVPSSATAAAAAAAAAADSTSKTAKLSAAAATTTVQAREAASELRLTSAAVGRVVLLERFRPMLLPRHAADVMAGLFQAERFRRLVVPDGEKEKDEDDEGWDDDGKAGSAEVMALFLGRRLQQRSPPSPSSDNRRDDQRLLFSSLTPIDPHTRARTYQTLMSGGTRTPPWLRQRVGSLLNHLASMNLRCVVDVFVVAAASLPTDDVSGASVRLGRVLCAVPYPTVEDIRAAAGKKGDGGGGGGGGACGVGGGSGRYYEELFRQLGLLLDAASGTGTAASSSGPSDPRVVAGVLTAWAVLTNAPRHVLEAYLLPLLVGGMVPPQSSITFGDNKGVAGGPTRQHYPSVRASVKRVCALLSFAPSTAMGLGKVFRLFLLPLRLHGTASNVDGTSQKGGGSVTLLGQLVRVAAADSDNVVEASKVGEDALWALRMLVHGLVSNESVRLEGLESKEQVKSLSVALVQSVCINGLDVAGFRFRRGASLDGREEEKQGGDCLEDVVLEQSTGASSTSLEELVQGMERRARVVVVDVVAPLSGPDSLEEKNASQEEKAIDPKEESDGDDSNADLPNSLFSLLLLIYFSGSTMSGPLPSSMSLSSQLLPRSFRQNLASIKLASMSMLPLCCEHCSPVALLLGGGESSKNGETFGVLDMIRLIIYCAGSRVGRLAGDEQVEEGATYSLDAANCGINYAACDVELLDTDAAAVDPNDDVDNESQQQENTAEDDQETVLSITSLVMSLLVAVLEMGTQKRSDGEETVLISMIPALHSLSLLDESVSSPPQGLTNASSAFQAELAEMSSHAMALISSRNAESMPSPPGSALRASKPEALFERVKQAELDLVSDQPPLRARGVVSLRHIARGYLEDVQKGTCMSGAHSGPLTNLTRKPLITEINDEDGNGIDLDLISSQGSQIPFIENLIRICITSLSDTESYVYLAAIQTIVALADVRPLEVVRILGRAVSLGRIMLAHSTSSTTYDVVNLELTSVQRIKLTEALLFTIRRRGDGVFSVGQSLMDMMVYGCKNRGSTQEGGEEADSTAFTIQSRTEGYYQGENVADEEEDTPESIAEERRLKVNTGGPVFDTEEEDVVRAACISVAAELVSALHPKTLVRYSPALVRLGMEVLRLESSRPMRRAAALLCRELYAVIVREMDEAQDEAKRDASVISFAVAMVSSGEDGLHATLKRCVSADDVDRVGVANGRSVQGRTRLYDPATVARCEEALAIRQTAEEMGILTAASLVAVSKEREDNDATAQAVIKRLKEKNSRSTESDSVEAMRGLKIDSENLRFLQ